jgi:hypothetical protein
MRDKKNKEATEVRKTTRELVHAEPVENLEVDAFAKKMADAVVAAVQDARKRQGKPPLEEG